MISDESCRPRRTVQRIGFATHRLPFRDFLRLGCLLAAALVSACGASPIGTPSPDLGTAALTTFEARLQGIWLIGWSGHLNHFSFFKFTVDSPCVGQALLLKPMGDNSWTPFFGCEGHGQWMCTQKPDTIQVHFPAQCNLMDAVLSFDQFQAHPAGFPNGAILDARVTLPPQGSQIGGYKFPDTQCDKAFTSCTLPN